MRGHAVGQPSGEGHQPGSWLVAVEPARGADVDHVAARLWMLGATGIQVHPRQVDGWFDRAPEEVAAASGPSVDEVLDDLVEGLRWRFVPDVDHLAAWRDATVAVSAGPFDIVPTHRVDAHPARTGRLRIVMDPGQAFGSGHHATTAGCLRALAQPDVGPPVRGGRVLDVGTGTGILAIGAVLLGADEVVGVDTDSRAVDVARDNVARNLGEPDTGRQGPVRLVVGSLDDVVPPFDVVVANLLTHTIVALADALHHATRPGGRLVASGIGVERAPLAMGALADAGFRELVRHDHHDWVVVTGRRAGRADPAREGATP